MKKGFTLIELLVVIAILAILAVVVVVVINPAELLKQSRDSTRLSDLSSLQSAIALYFADYQTSSWVGSVIYCTYGTIKPGGATGCTTNTSTAVNGAGWVNGIYFDQISSGAPLSKLPLDPINDSSYYYAFSKGNIGEYKLYARMESKKYYPYQANDGGMFNTCTAPGTTSTICWYEIGSKMELNP